MELIALAGLVGLGVWAYRSGKRNGSRQGFNAGRHAKLRSCTLHQTRIGETMKSDEIVEIALFTLVVGIMLTPIFGSWIWITLLFTTWGLWLASSGKLSEQLSK